MFFNKISTLAPGCVQGLNQMLNEGEVEYERLSQILIWKQVEGLALKIHSSQGHLFGTSKLRHLYTVADLSCRWAKSFYTANDFQECHYRMASCQAIGLLHETMRYGATFEELVEAADETVARSVAELTEDVRLPYPRRLKLLANQVGLAGEPAQLVQLADLCADVSLFAGKGKVTVSLDWLERASEVCTVLTKLHASAELSSRLRSVRSGLDQIDKKAYSNRSNR